MSGNFLFSPINGNGPFGHLGPAAGTAYNPRAPLDEQLSAEKEVIKLYGRDPGAAFSPEFLEELQAFARESQQRAATPAPTRPVSKALQWERPGSRDAKAQTQPALQRLGGTMGGLYVPKPGLPFAALRHLGRRIEIVQAILRQRQRQVLAFCEPAKLDSEPGWMLGAGDQDANLSDDHTEFLAWLQQFLLCGGRVFDPLGRRAGRREDFRTALSKLTLDSLTLDHAAVETVPLRTASGLDAFWVRDGGTFYLAPDDADDTFAVQDLSAAERVEFRFDELAVLQRNPQTDLEWCGYGYGELEAGLDTLSTLLSAFAYTRESLDNNAIPRGILLVSGNYQPQAWQQFQAAWRQRLRGASNAHGLPVLQSQTRGDVSYIQTGAPVSEMAFAKWISLQTAILCSLYGMDPTELGMEAYAAGSTSTLSGSDTGERLASAKDKGLRPLLRDISAFISDNILARFTRTPWVRFRFTGLDRLDEAQAEQERARLATIDELRAKHGMGPHPQAWIGALPADPGLQSAEFQRLQAVATLGEGRAAWGGLPAYPDETLNAAPLNPSMQAAYNMALQAKAAENAPDPFDGMDPEAGADVPEPPQDGLGGDVAGHLQALSGPLPGDEEEEVAGEQP